MPSLAQTSYDAAGYPRQEWEARADTSAGHLTTGYGHDESGTGMLLSTTPPGQAASTYSCDTNFSSATYPHLLLEKVDVIAVLVALGMSEGAAAELVAIAGAVLARWISDLDDCDVNGKGAHVKFTHLGGFSCTER